MSQGIIVFTKIQGVVKGVIYDKHPTEKKKLKFKFLKIFLSFLGKYM